MKTDQRIGITAISFLCPGFAHAVVGRRTAAMVWATLAFVPCVLGVLGAAMLGIAALVHLAAPIDAYRVVRRERGSPPWSGLWPGVTLGATVAAIAVLSLSLKMYTIPSSSMLPGLQVKQAIFVDKLTIHVRGPKRGEVVLFDYPCDPKITYVKRVIALAGDTVEVRCDVVYVNGAPLKSELVTERDAYRDFDETTSTWFTREASRYREHHGGHTYEVFYEPERPAHDREGGATAAHDFPKRDSALVPNCQQGQFFDKPNTQPTGSIVTMSRATKPCELQSHYVVPPGSFFVMGDNRSNANDSRVWGAVSVGAVTGRLIEGLQ